LASLLGLLYLLALVLMLPMFFPTHPVVAEGTGDDDAALTVIILASSQGFASSGITPS